MTTVGGTDAGDADVADDAGDAGDTDDAELADTADTGDAVGGRREHTDRGHGHTDVATHRDRDADTTTGDERHVVTVFLRDAGEVLLLRRSDAVGTYQGRWGAVSGYAEGDPDAAARWEIDEETGLADAVTLVRRGDPVAFIDDDLDVRWVVHPFLFDCTRRDAEPNEEIAETAWVAPPEIRRRETVPELWTAYDRVRPRVETVATDTDHGSAWLSLRALEVLRDEAALVATDTADDPVDRDARDAVAGRGDDWTIVAATAEALLDARPSMTALANRVHRAMDAAADVRTAAAVERAAHERIERALDADRQASVTATERLAGETVLTLSRSGTVERALSPPTRSDGPDHVYVAESRPAREGVGVAERLAGAGVDVTLVTDAAAAHVLCGGLGRDVDRVVVGADTVRPDGSVVNKTGTRGVAIAAATDDVPVDVVAAADKIAATGSDPAPGETGSTTAVYDGDADVAVANPTFDRTPAAFVTGVVTELGVLDAAGVRDAADACRDRTTWRDLG